jgi:predicted metal-binding membrane protein
MAVPGAIATATVTLTRQRNFILGTLLALAAGSWGILAWQSYSGPSPSPGGGTASLLTMGMGIPLFMAMWVAMMAAMMFPTAAPMTLMFARLQSSRRTSGKPYVPTAFFVTSYLALWVAAGALAFLAATLIGRVADQSPWLLANGPRITGGIIILAGLYQLSPLKAVCLRTCRSPLSFILNHWRDGRRGSMVMGVQHAAYCLGCCWLLFVLLFPLGIMNLAAMGVITAFIFAEKSAPWGMRIANGLGVALVVFGIVVAVLPSSLPGGTVMMGM